MSQNRCNRLRKLLHLLYNKIKIKLSFGCGFIHMQEDEYILSDYWSEDERDNLSEDEIDRWLDDFYNYWKSNYEDGAACLLCED